MKLNIFGIFLLFMILPLQGVAVTSACKANVERFNSALKPYAQINIPSSEESLRHYGWMAQEMVYVAKNGCEPDKYADERQQLESFEASLQEAIQTCRQISRTCSPQQYSGASGYRRPEMIRASGSPGLSASQSGSNSTSATGNGDRNFLGRSSESDVNQSIALAESNQSRAEEQRKKDRRRRNYAELDASSCLTPEVRPGFTGFKNSCPYPVRYTYCVTNPISGTGAAFVDCSKQSGAGTVPANGEDFAHMKGAEGVSHVACKPPGTAVTRKFENGQLLADCAKLGGD